MGSTTLLVTVLLGAGEANVQNQAAIAFVRTLQTVGNDLAFTAAIVRMPCAF